jgi:hypothetical protein
MGRGEPLLIALQHACFAGFQHASLRSACQHAQASPSLVSTLRAFTRPSLLSVSAFMRRGLVALALRERRADPNLPEDQPLLVAPTKKTAP